MRRFLSTSFIRRAWKATTILILMIALTLNIMRLMSIIVVRVVLRIKMVELFIGRSIKQSSQKLTPILITKEQ